MNSNQTYLKLSSFERRNVTVLECDLVGSTRLANSLEPEQLKDLLLLYQKLIRQCIGEMHGYIAQYAGDAVWAYFGVDETEKDDIYRAICSALNIIEKIETLRPFDKKIQVRIGLATGLCVVGELYDETGGLNGQLEKRIAAFGNPPNLAARLQAMAEPGTIVVSDTTQTQTSALFEFEDLKWHQFKGFPKPMKVWRVLARKDEPETQYLDNIPPKSTELLNTPRI